MKTLLIITYYWPPSGGSGVQRWLKFANYLVEQGYSPIVVTPENPQFELKDPSLEEEVRPEIEVLKLPIWEPYQILHKIKKSTRHEQGQTSMASWAKFMRGNFFIPDPRIFWKRPVLRFLNDFLKQRKVDFIISTGPPHSMHLIALSLRDKFKIPWLADFRDPWSRWDMLDEFQTTALARILHRRLERKVVRNADIVLTVSRTWAGELSDMYDRDIKVITNGYDHRDFQNLTQSLPGKFRLAHFGLINQFRYSPVFWEVLDDMIRSNASFAKDVEIDLYGVIDSRVKEALKDLDALSEKYNFHGTVSHREVLNVYGNSTVLLMFMNRSANARGHIPGKLFEYLASRKPILALGDSQGDAARIIEESGAGVVLEWDDKANIRSQLNSLYDSFRQGKMQLTDTEKIRKYQRRELTYQLIDILDEYDRG